MRKTTIERLRHTGMVRFSIKALNPRSPIFINVHLFYKWVLCRLYAQNFACFVLHDCPWMACVTCLLAGGSPIYSPMAAFLLPVAPHEPIKDSTNCNTTQEPGNDCCMPLGPLRSHLLCGGCGVVGGYSWVGLEGSWRGAVHSQLL